MTVQGKPPERTYWRNKLLDDTLNEAAAMLLDLESATEGEPVWSAYHACLDTLLLAKRDLGLQLREARRHAYYVSPVAAGSSP
jgi:hypothetical protein